MTKEKWQGHLAIIVTNIIFGINIPISKSILSGWISPFALSLTRMGVAALILWIFTLFAEKEKVSGKDLKTIALAAFFGLAGAQISFAVALEYTTPVNLSIITSMTPVIVMLLAAWWLKEPITWKKGVGVMLGISGALIIIINSYTVTQGENRLLGNLLGLVNITTYAVYLVLIRKIAPKYSVITLMKWMFLFAIPLCIPFGIKELADAPVFSAGTTPDALLKLGFVVLFATVITYFLLPIGLKRIRPTTASMYNNIQPIMASSIAIFVGQDIFTWDKVVALFLVLGGVYLVTQSRSKEDTR